MTYFCQPLKSGTKVTRLPQPCFEPTNHSLAAQASQITLLHFESGHSSYNFWTTRLGGHIAPPLFELKLILYSNYGRVTLPGGVNGNFSCRQYTLLCPALLIFS